MPDNPGGIQREFHRMIDERLRKPEQEKFFNLLQFITFSNNMEYEITKWAGWIEGMGSPQELFRIQEDSCREMQVLDEIRQLLSIRFPADEIE